jgi:hypothetical protein
VGSLLAANVDELANILFDRHPGESRGPELPDFPGFRLSPE